MTLKVERLSSSTERAEQKLTQIDIIENPPSYPDGVRLLRVDFKDSTSPREIPVYNCRIDSHHRFIANDMASHKAAVAFGVGLYGLGSLVHDPRVKEYEDSYQAFFRAKSGRSELDKIPLQTPPKYLLEFMDLEKVHTDFRRYFETPEAREDFWKIAIAIHVLGPINESSPRIHRIFVTTPEDWERKQAPLEQRKDFSTASFFWWHDPDWERIANIMERKNPDSIMGISSFNEHREPPAWNFNDVVEFIRKKNIAPFNLVVTDPIGEGVGVKSSFAQIQVPTVKDKPEWLVYRDGPSDLDVLMEKLTVRFGVKHTYRRLGSAKLAARGYDASVNLQGKMDLVQRRVQEDYNRRHPKHNIFATLKQKS